MTDILKKILNVRCGLKYKLMLIPHTIAIASEQEQEGLKTTSKMNLYLRSLFLRLKNRNAFQDVQMYCLFLGYARGGGSILGSLLDAHPNTIVSHELDALGLFQHRFFKRDQIYSLILENSQQFAKYGRGWSGYSYEVPGQWQGKFEKIKVIGDKKGGRAGDRIANTPNLLNTLKESVNCKVKVVHYVRNPFDVISTFTRKTILYDGLCNEAIDRHFDFVQCNSDIKRQTPSEDYLEGRYEDFILDPKGYLKRCCEFLGLEPDEKYLEDCVSIIHPSANKSRHKIKWSDAQIKRTQDHIDRYEVLKGYTYES